MANSDDVLARERKERLALIQMALGKVSVDFMRQSSDVVMPVEALLETASQLEEIWAAEVRALRKDRELLVKLHAAWTYPHAGSIGALLDEVAERVEPGIFGDAAMAAERGEGEVK